MNNYSSIDKRERFKLKYKLHSSFPIIQAVIEGVQEGQVFKSTCQDYWVLHKAGFSEVFFKVDDGKELVNFIIANESLPKYFHIYNPPQKLTDIFKSLTEVFNIRERNRIQLTFEGKRKERFFHNSLSDEFYLTHITKANFDSLHVFNLDLANKFWNGKDEFVKNALGFLINDNQNNPISICYAAAVADQKAEIDVITLEKYRGRGIAKIIVNNFIEKCFLMRLTPNWDSFEENYASLRISHSMEFILTKKYLFISIFQK